jgi:hypothetical protein
VRDFGLAGNGVSATQTTWRRSKNAYELCVWLPGVLLTGSIHDRGGDVLRRDLWRDGHLGHDVLDLGSGSAQSAADSIAVRLPANEARSHRSMR